MATRKKQDITMHTVGRIIRQFSEDDFGSASDEYKRAQYDYLATLNFLNKDFILRTIRLKMRWEK